MLVLYSRHSTDSHSHRHLTRPDGKVVGIHAVELAADRADVVDQPQLLERVGMRRRRRVDVEVREREDAGPLPLLDLGLDLRGPHEVGLVRAPRTVLWDGHVVVGAPDLVLGAVAALREVLVTPDVSTFAGAGQSRLTGEAKGPTGLTMYHSPSEIWCGLLWDVSLLYSSQGEESAYLLRGGPPPGPAILDVCRRVDLDTILSSNVSNAYSRMERNGNARLNSDTTRLPCTLRVTNDEL